MMQILKSALFCLLLALPLVACDKEEPGIFVETSERYVADNLPEYDALVAAKSGEWQEYCEAADALANKHKRDNGGITLVGSSTFTYWYDFKSYMDGLPVRNMGIGGATVFDLICNGEKLIYPYKPSVIVIYVGDNDLASFSFGEFKNAFDVFFANIKHRLPNVDVVLVGMKPSPLRLGHADGYAKIDNYYSEIATLRSDVHYLRIWDDLSDNNKIWESDKIHFNKAGYQIFASKLVPLLKEIWKNKLNQ